MISGVLSFLLFVVTRVSPFELDSQKKTLSLSLPFLFRFFSRAVHCVFVLSTTASLIGRPPLLESFPEPSETFVFF